MRRKIPKGTDPTSFMSNKKHLVVLLDKFKSTQEESNRILNILDWLCENQYDRVFRIFSVQSQENFCDNSYFVILRHLKSQRMDFNKFNFNDQFFTLLVRKTESSLSALVGVMDSDDQINFNDQMNKTLEFVFFILNDASEALLLTKNFPIESVCSVFIKLFSKMELIKQISLVTRICVLASKFEDRSGQLSSKLKSLVFSLYLNNFHDSEIRMFIAGNLIEFSNDFLTSVHSKLLDYYTLKYTKKFNSFKLSFQDLQLLRMSITHLTDKQSNKINELISFFSSLSGVFGWQIMFFHSLLTDFIQSFWVSSGLFEKQFNQFFDHFFTKLLDFSFNIIKGKKTESTEAFRLEFYPTLYLLKQLIVQNKEFFQSRFLPNCVKLETHIGEYFTKYKKKNLDMPFEHNSYFKALCHVVGHQLNPFNAVIAEKRKTGNNADETTVVPLRYDLDVVHRKKTLVDCQEENTAINDNDAVGSFNRRSVRKSQLYKKLSKIADVRQLIEFKNKPVIKSIKSIDNIKNSIDFMEIQSCHCFGESNQLEEKILSQSFFVENHPLIKKTPNEKNKNENSQLVSNFKNSEIFSKKNQNFKTIKNRGKKELDSLIKKIRRKNNKENQKEILKTIEIEKKNDKLNSMVEKRLNTYGNSLINPLKNDSPYYQLCKNIDKDQRMNFPNNFNFSSLRNDEKKAMINNFMIHKNLFKLHFNNLSKTCDLIVVDKKINQSVKKPHEILSVKSFGDFVKAIHPEYHSIETSQIVRLFSFLNSRHFFSPTLKDQIVFAQFSHAVFQFSHLTHFDPLTLSSPFDCFSIFLERFKFFIKNDLLFENDEILNVNCDRNLLGFYQRKINTEMNIDVPENFEVKTVTEYYRPKSVEKSPLISPGRLISEVVLKSLIWDLFDIRFDTVKLEKKNYYVVVQRQQIDYDFTKKHQKENMVVNNSRIERLSLPKIGNDFLHKKTFKLTPNPIDDIPLNYKIMVLNNKQYDKKRMIDVASLLDQMIKKIELVSGNKQVDLHPKTGKILNDFEKKREAKILAKNSEKIKSPDNVLKMRYFSIKPKCHLFAMNKSLKSIREKIDRLMEKDFCKNYRFDPQKAEKSDDKSNVKKENLKLKKRDQSVDNVNHMKYHKLEIKKGERLVDKDPLKFQQLEEFKNQKKLEKIKKNKEKENKEKMIKKELKKLVNEFKDKNLPKLDMYIRKSEKMGQERKNQNKSMTVELISPIKNNEIIEKLNKLNESQKFKKEKFLDSLRTIWSKSELTVVFEKHSQKMQDIFRHYASKFNGSDLIKLHDLIENNFRWTFKELYHFMKDHGGVPSIFSIGELKYAFNFVLNCTQSKNGFGFDQFKFFLVYTHLVLKEKKDEIDLSIYEVNKVEKTLKFLIEEQSKSQNEVTHSLKLRMI